MTRRRKERASMRITRSAAQQIEIHIGNHRAERGAMLGEDSEGTICRVEVDHGARRNTVEYSPDTARLNQVIKAWKAEGIGFADAFRCRTLARLHGVLRALPGPVPVRAVLDLQSPAQQ